MSEPQLRKIKQSKTDPESGFMIRDNKPKGFFYLDHRTVDTKANIITDVHVTAGNVHDAVPYLARLERQTQRFGFNVQYVGLDAGYHTTAISKGLEDKGVKAVFGYRRPTHRQGYLRKREFIYIAETDQYVCPQGQALIYSTTNREGYRHYVSDPAVCRQCPLLSRCTQNAKQQKTVTRHVWEDSRERQDANRLMPWGKAIYQRRKETVERSFADAKELHQYRYARYRGRHKVQAQCLMTAAAQNIKKIALLAG